VHWPTFTGLFMLRAAVVMLYLPLLVWTSQHAPSSGVGCAGYLMRRWRSTKGWPRLGPLAPWVLDPALVRNYLRYRHYPAEAFTKLRDGADFPDWHPEGAVVSRDCDIRGGGSLSCRAKWPTATARLAASPITHSTRGTVALCTSSADRRDSSGRRRSHQRTPQSSSGWPAWARDWARLLTTCSRAAGSPNSLSNPG